MEILLGFLAASCIELARHIRKREGMAPAPEVSNMGWRYMRSINSAWLSDGKLSIGLSGDGEYKGIVLDETQLFDVIRLLQRAMVLHGLALPSEPDDTLIQFWKDKSK